MRDMLMTDYLSLPWQYPKYCYAWLVWKLKTFIKILKAKDKIQRKFASWRGRHDDPQPAVCGRCMWMGMRKWLVHGYQDDGSGEDVVAVDECPRCGYEM